MRHRSHKVNKFLPILISVILVVGMLTNRSSIEAFVKTKIDQYLYVSSCDSPIHYKIGQVDPQFNLSQTEFSKDVTAATEIWDKVEGKSLFVYDQQNPSSLVVSMVFDKRQQLQNQIGSLKSQVNQTDQNLQPQIQQYNQQKANFEQKLADLNAQIDSWNAKGGAPPDEYQKLAQEQNDLKKEADQLNQEAKLLNLNTQSYNLQVNNLNKTINTFNDALSLKPEEGLYDPKSNSITIYFDNSYNELVHTLAHELGHSLGLDHNQNSGSIMFPYTTDETTPSKDDMAALNQICQTRYLNLPRLINL